MLTSMVSGAVGAALLEAGSSGATGPGPLATSPWLV